VRNAVFELGPPKTRLAVTDELAGADISKLRKHVYIACGVLGIDPTTCCGSSKNGERETACSTTKSANIYPIPAGAASPSKTVCRDLKELVNVAPDLDTAANYEKVLLSIRNEHFDVINRDDPEHWFPNGNARKITVR
jgi:hypothetical protein